MIRVIRVAGLASALFGLCPAATYAQVDARAHTGEAAHHEAPHSEPVKATAHSGSHFGEVHESITTVDHSNDVVQHTSGVAPGEHAEHVERRDHADYEPVARPTGAHRSPVMHGEERATVEPTPRPEEKAFRPSATSNGPSLSSHFADADRRLPSRPPSHQAQERAAADGRSWSAQRRTFWRAEAQRPDAAERYGQDNHDRMTRGQAPQYPDMHGRMRSAELHHEPKARREAGIKVVPVTPDQHERIDPHRQVRRK